VKGRCIEQVLGREPDLLLVGGRTSPISKSLLPLSPLCAVCSIAAHIIIIIAWCAESSRASIAVGSSTPSGALDRRQLSQLAWVGACHLVQHLNPLG
jgi:hypothetical protein